MTARLALMPELAWNSAGCPSFCSYPQRDERSEPCPYRTSRSQSRLRYRSRAGRRSRRSRSRIRIGCRTKFPSPIRTRTRSRRNRRLYSYPDDSDLFGWAGVMLVVQSKSLLFPLVTLEQKAHLFRKQGGLDAVSNVGHNGYCLDDVFVVD